MHSSFRNPTWLAALSLVERDAALTANDHGAAATGELMTERMRRWRSKPPFDRDPALARRLAADDLTEERFAAVLAAPESAYAGDTPRPQWLDTLEAAYLASPSSADAPRSPRGHPAAGFFGAVEPLVRWELARVARALDEIEGRGPVPWEREALMELLRAHFPDVVADQIGRTMALELQVARHRGQLAGDTPEERFASFAKSLHDPSVILPLLEEYPVLARILATSLQQWADYAVEFLGHLAADWKLLETHFVAGGELGLLAGLTAGAGDTHCRGRSVIVATFDSGVRLVYKPRSLQVDCRFAELLLWLNERGVDPGFRPAGVLDRGAYGWVEFIKPEPCTTRDEVQRFYQRQGANLAVLYALEATDLHFENLIAAGEYPVLIDLEALFHPRLPRRAIPAEASSAADDDIQRSVLRIGLLPYRLWSGGSGDGLEISGIGGASGQMSPAPLLTWEGMGSDEMRAVHKHVRLSGRDNRARLTAAPVDATEFADDMARGFQDAYTVIWRNADALARPGGWLDGFADAPVRVVMRPTTVYGQILRESFHPDVLRDALERDRLLDSLWGYTEQTPELHRLIRAEQKDLRRGDIPFFTTFPRSRDVWSSDGECIPECLVEPSLDSVRARVLALSPADLERQLWYIRASISTLSLGRPHTEGPRPEASPAAPAGEWAGDPREMAIRVGDRLCHLAAWAADEVSWVGLTLVGERAWSLRPIGFDVYGGTLGIGHFMAYLGAVTGEARFTRVAESTLTSFTRRMLPHLMAGGESAAVPMGALSGCGSFVYALSHLGTLWGDATILDQAVRLAVHVEAGVEHDRSFDVVNGSAGWALALASLHQATSDERVLGAMVRAGDHLLAHAQPVGGGGAGWSTQRPGSRPLAGASHGSAGIAAALAAVAAASGEARFEAGARAALVHERGLFDEDTGNWADLRELPENGDGLEPAGASTSMLAWCHGAPGVGLMRTRMARQVEDPMIHEDMRRAATATARSGFGGNHSLCHGDLGNLEALSAMEECLGAGEFRPAIAEETRRVLESIRRQGWLCGVPTGAETPGLLNGLAGIGFGLLRLAAPGAVPSVLRLDGPRLPRGGGRQP